MPELKHNFLKGRMNKDLDERLVPNGEYRDALNIEVSTSEGSNAGTVQTVMGNKKLSDLNFRFPSPMDTTKCVGKILDEKNDKLYWFVSELGNRPNTPLLQTPEKYGDFTVSDLILEIDIKTDEVRPVVVDTFYSTMELTGYDPNQGDGRWISLDSASWSGNMQYTVHPGMEVDCVDGNGNPVFPEGTAIVDVNLPQFQVKVSNPPIDPADMQNNFALYKIKFENFNRALNFQNKLVNGSTIITGINIIDNLLFWTDNNSEPKKINIDTSKKEREINPYVGNQTGLDFRNDFQTQSVLIVSNTTGTNPGAKTVARGNAWSNTALVPLEEKHITVIRKSPSQALSLVMRNSIRSTKLSGTLDYSNPSGRVALGTTNPNSPPPLLYPNQTKPGTSAPSAFNPFWDYSGNQVKESCWVDFGGPNSRINQIPLLSQGGNPWWASSVPIYEVGDVVIFTTQTFPEEVIRAKVTGRDMKHGSYNLDILSFSGTIGADDKVYDAILEQPDPLFEFKFPRFSYRYKYEDGEYSAFAPFTEVAFLPEDFEYVPKKGYNLGMTNNIRKLVLKDFVDSKSLPKDVVSIDILYKESNSPNVYTVKTITKDDFEWDAISESELAPSDQGRYFGSRGYINITSELIHAILPSNQLLRPWDNVPRKALGQEIAGNRLVYGNYLQNYDMRSNSGSNININLQLSSTSKAVGSDNIGSFNYTPEQNDAKNAYRYSPSKSIKTLRTYQLGVVYRDKYGRETPVFSTDIKKDGGDTSKASLYLEKKLADQQNKLKAQIKNAAPSWAETYKFFIKETSNEYYNLAMDRWYDAADDNIWLSFPSSERNKVDIDTFLILKKEKDNDVFVPDPARYKILAIENEAPLFIKTVEHNLGKLNDNNDKDMFRTSSTSSTGFPVENAGFMYVRSEGFGDDTNFGMGWHESIIKQAKPNLYMRMRTASVTSNWYKIRSISLEQGLGSGSTDMYRIDIEKGVFGPDMNITCSTPNSVNSNSIAAGLALEIKQDVIENRPEYQGRFFVKIYKDDVIVDRLIKPTLEALEYVVQEARDIKYIHTCNDTEDSDGSYTSEGISNWAATNGWDGSGTGPGQDTNVEYIHRENITTTNNSFPPIPTVNDDYETFWSGHPRCWFIDRAHAGRMSHWKSVYQGQACGEVELHHSWTSPFYPENNNGRGIYNNGYNMHLSWHRPGERALWSCNDWDNSGSDWDGIRNMFDNTQIDEVSFISKLTAPGTLFRWREDPDQHIYITKATWQPNPNAGLNFGKHLYNFYDWYGNPAYPRVKGFFFQYAHRNRFHVEFERLADGQPMGATGGKHNAQYSPVNDPGTVGWFDSDGVNLAEKGTCSPNSAHDNDEQGCEDAGGTWTWASDAFYADATYASSNNVAIGSWKTTAPTTKAPGIRQDGHGGSRKYKDNAETNPGAWFNQAGEVTLEIIEPLVRGADLENASTNPAIWETEPKEDIGLDIYYEVGQIYPVEINNKTNELFAPIGSVVECWRSTNTSWYSNNETWDSSNGGFTTGTDPTPAGNIPLGQHGANWTPPIRVKSWNDNIVTLEDEAGNLFNNNSNWPNEHIMPEDHLVFRRPDGSKTSALIGDATNINGAEYTVRRDVHNRTVTLPWHNCYSFGNGVESDRIRDDFNQVKIDNGSKASTTLDEPYLEERRGSGFIWSGIYNSTSGINNLNQFIQAEKITKDLNPSYGSIQKLHQRDTDLITLCEDKVLKVLANKDALFNADGNANLTATENVLGQTTPFAGEFGISKNPESFVSESFRAYFTDKQRGAVMRLSRDGLTPISEVGMKDWFADNLRTSQQLIGSYDDKKSTYNLTLVDIQTVIPQNTLPNQQGSGGPVLGPALSSTQSSSVYAVDNSKTISFSEKSKGWTSFKSFIPEIGESLNNNYYTFKAGDIWRHHDKTVSRNNFYDNQHNSIVNVLFNDLPGSVKSIRTLNYEGSQARITQNLQDAEYYNNEAKFGWYVDNIKTDLQDIKQLEFKGKEGKWFSAVKGESTNLSNLDTREFSVQGIGNASAVSGPSGSIYGCTDVTATNYDPTATIDDGSCIVISYNCTLNGCIDPGDGSGQYSTWCDCMEQGNGSLLSNPTGGCCGGAGYPFGQYESLCLGDPQPPTIYGCTDPSAFNYYTAVQIDNCSCVSIAYGCTDPVATNYNPVATNDDGSCTYSVSGCTDPTMLNYNPNATIDDGSCIPIVYGCMDPTALNYYISANADDGTCLYPTPTPSCVTQPVTWSWDGTALAIATTAFDPAVLFPSATSSHLLTQTKVLRSDGTEVLYLQTHSQSPIAFANLAMTTSWTWSNPFSNITPGSYTIVQTVFDGATLSDPILSQCSTGITIPAPTVISGCTNPSATNYDPTATIDDGSCILVVNGCTKPCSSNYDPNATVDDGSCDPECCHNAPTASTYQTHQNHIIGPYTPQNHSNDCGNSSVPGMGCKCEDIIQGDYNQEWIDAGSQIWDATTTYQGSTTCDDWGNCKPTLLVKHNNVIYVGLNVGSSYAQQQGIAQNILAPIPAGIEPGVFPQLQALNPPTSIEINGHVYDSSVPGDPDFHMYVGNGHIWVPATSYYYKGTLTYPECCQRLGCPDVTQVTFDPYVNEIGGWTTSLAHCVPIVFGCTDDQAMNYYTGAHINNNTCIYGGCMDNTATNYWSGFSYDCTAAFDPNGNNYTTATGCCTYA